MNSNNCVFGIKDTLSEFFSKYLEKKLNPLYNQLNSNPKQLFNFIFLHLIL